MSLPLRTERIICAAIHNPEDVDMAGEPLIYCGLRHHNILRQGKHVSRNPYHQGFLTDTGRFVDRLEAFKIAIDAGQIIDITKTPGETLYSEDIY